MNPKIYRFLQALVLTGLGAFMLERFVSGKLLWYISARFAWLTVVGILICFALALFALDWLRRSRLADHGHAGHSHSQADDHESAPSGWGVVLLAAPLALGLLIPARPLGAAAVNSKGGMVNASLSAGDRSLLGQTPPQERTVLDWVRIFNHENDLTPHLGQPANVIGFVYHDPRLPEGQFMVSRFAVSCCVADAFALGMAVVWPDAAGLPSDTWVNVSGAVQFLEVDGRRVPLVLAESVTPISPPEKPYLFP